MQTNGKYIAPGTDEPCHTVTTQNRLGICFISKAYSGAPESKNISINEPSGAITTIDHHQFISTYYSPGYNTSVKEAVGTIRCKDCMSLVSPKFLSAYYGNGFNMSIEVPSSTITTKDRLSLVSSQYFLDMQYGNGTSSDISKPAPTVTVNPKHQLVQCDSWLMSTNFNNIGSSLDKPSPVITANRKWHYLMNPQYSSAGGSVDKPCFTLIARMDKMPPYLIQASSNTTDTPSFIKIIENTLVYEVYDNDSPILKSIKEFMALYGLIDIKMRMLLIIELLRITGFPEDYILKGSQADQKKFIGNAVECTQSQVLAEAVCATID